MLGPREESVARMSTVTTHTLRQVLRDALAGRLQDGWMYQPAGGNLTLDSTVMIVDDDGDVETDSHGTPLVAIETGCAEEGLECRTIAETAACAQSFVDPPSDELLLESYRYYWKNDAWLPEPGAPDPPVQSLEESLLEEDREFYDSLADEDDNKQCRREGCHRGTTRFSVFCKTHHLENIKGRPCPFDH